MNVQAAPSTICAILFRRVGDSLLATPAIRALKEHYPKSIISVVCEPQVKRVFEHLDFIDRLTVITRSPGAFNLAQTITRHERPEMLLDFLSDPRSVIAGFLARVPCRIGFDYGFRSCLLHRKAPLQSPNQPVYSAVHKLKLASLAGSISTDYHTSFVLTDQDRSAVHSKLLELKIEPESFIAVFPYSRRDYKRWAPARYEEVCRALAAIGLRLLFFSGPGEVSYVTGIASRMQDLKLPYVQLDTLEEMTALLETAACYLGNDGGPKHLAVAVDTPTVTIFRNDPPEYWTPPESSRHIALQESESGVSLDSDVVVNAVLQQVSSHTI